MTGQTRGTTGKRAGAWRRAAWAALALLALAVVLAVAVRPERFQWDFRTYWLAARVQAEGGNPYDPASLARLAGEPIELPFLYPPATLSLFGMFARLPYPSAYAAWLVFKLAALAALLVLWRHRLPPVLDPLALAAAALLGFGAAAVWDLQSGNVSALEQLLLWGALACFIAGRALGFGLLLAAAAVPKMAPLALLPLAWWLPASRARRLAVLAGAPALCGALLLGPSGLRAEWLAALAGQAAAPLPTGPVNPSALALIGEAAARAAGGPGRQTPLVAALFAAYAALIAAISLPALRRLARAGDRAALAAAALIVYSLLSPRFMIYAYISVVPAVLLLWHRLAAGRDARAALLALLCLPGVARLPLGLGTAADHYGPLLLNLAAWLLYVHQGRRERAAAHSRPCNRRSDAP